MMRALPPDLSRIVCPSRVLPLILVLVAAQVPAEPRPGSPDLRVSDLRALGAVAARQRVPIVMLFGAAYCDYCTRLREAFLIPMVVSGDYAGRALIREVDLDDPARLRDFSGRAASPAALAGRYGVRVTPTVVFLDPRGRALVPPIVGFTSEDLYGLYLDAAIEQAGARLGGDPLPASREDAYVP